MEKLGQQIAVVGLAIYVAFAPHSVAASAIGVAIAGIGWVIRTFGTGSLGLRRSKFDLIIVLSLLWTVASALLSEEPRISIAKLQASWCVFLFYLARATLRSSSALALVALLIVSGSAGALYSAFDLLRGRGVVVESIAAGSPFSTGRDSTRRHDLADQSDVEFIRQPTSTNYWRSTAEHAGNRGNYLAGRAGRAFTYARPASSFASGVDWKRAQSSLSGFGLDAPLRDLCRVDADDCAARTRSGAGPSQKSRAEQISSESRLWLLALLTAGLVFTAMRTVIVAFVIGATRDRVAIAARQATNRLYVRAVLRSGFRRCGRVANARSRCAVAWAIRALRCERRSLVLAFRASRFTRSLDTAWTRCRCTGPSGVFPAKTCFTCIRLRYNSPLIADCRCWRFGSG